MRNTTRSIRRASLAGALVLLLGALCYAAVRGPLFPWSPLRPGYAALASARATVIFPKRAGLPATYRRIGGIVAEVERVNRLRFRRPLTVVHAGSWGLFVRGALIGTRAAPIPVLGAALQTGTVVYVSPLVNEPGRSLEGVLRHELTHALLFQQMPLRRSFGLVALDWFEEGLAVHFGNPGDYLDDRAWRGWAAWHGYRFGPQGHPTLEHLPAELRGSFRLAEYRLFVHFLMSRHGPERFFAFRDEVLRDPPRHLEAFRRVLGEDLSSAVGAFERAVRAGEWPRPPRRSRCAGMRAGASS